MNRKRLCFLIDNDEDDRELFGLALQEIDQNFEYATACSGPEAIERLQSDPSFLPSIVFIDMNMPLMNGVQCLHSLRNFEQVRNIPVYLYTTSSNPRWTDEAAGNTATGVLTKPASFSELVALLASVLQQQMK
jgi:CheY-like chemotaxis protein